MSAEKKPEQSSDRRSKIVIAVDDAPENRALLKAVIRGLGERFETLRISLKFYSCVGSNHTTLDAIRSMRRRRPFGADDVDRIVVHASQSTVDHVGWKYRPDGMTAAQLNLPFCLATLLLEGDVFVDQFSDAALADPRRMALAQKVSVVHDPGITARGGKFRHQVRVEVHLRDGARLEEAVEAPSGSEEKFASEGDIVGKFRKLAGRVLPGDRLDRIIELVMGLEAAADAAPLARALGAAG